MNSMFLAIIFFIFYAGLSYLWGSEYLDSKIYNAVPSVNSFYVSIKTENQIKYLLIIFIAGFIYPILGSTYVIISELQGNFIIR
jgi:hypothetical protein